MHRNYRKKQFQLLIQQLYFALTSLKQDGANLVQLMTYKIIIIQITTQSAFLGMIASKCGIWQPLNTYLYETPLFAGELYSELDELLFLELYSDRLVNVIQTTKLLYLDINAAFLTLEQNSLMLSIDGVTLRLKGAQREIKQWYFQYQQGHEQLKRYCLFSNFSESYQLLSRAKFFEGFVFVGKQYSNGQFCYVQILQEFELNANVISIHRKLNDPNLQRLQCVYKEEGQTFLVFDHFPGFPLSRKKEKVSEKQLASWIYQTLQGIKYMHSKRVFHNQVNSNNILVTDDKVYLINFEGANFQQCNEDQAGVYKILRSFQQNDYSASFKDFLVKIQHVDVNQALFHQWFINRHIRYISNAQSLVTILEKTEHDASMLDSYHYQHRKSDDFGAEPEESTLFKNYSLLQCIDYVPSKKRHAD